MDLGAIEMDLGLIRDFTTQLVRAGNARTLSPIFGFCRREFVHIKPRGVRRVRCLRATQQSFCSRASDITPRISLFPWLVGNCL